MDQNYSKCPARQARRKSLATFSSECTLEAKSENAQCSSTCSKPRSKYSWRRLLSYLPSWFRPANPDSAAPDIQATPCTKPNPAIQICHATPCRPVEAGHRQTQQEIVEKRCIKKPSHEKILSSFTFEDVNSDHKPCAEPCKKSGFNICGKHSTSTDTSCNKCTKPIQVEVASVSSHKGSNTCACNENKTTKTPISMSSSKCCKPSLNKYSSSNRTCQESLLDQAWAYLQSLISTHRSGCQRCNQRQSNDQMNAKTSNDSNTCKQTLLAQALSYLKKITSDHRSGCSWCQQKQPRFNSSETSHCQTMLEQAWLYFKKMRSETNTCCQRCKNNRKRVCCKHSTNQENQSRKQCPTIQPCSTHSTKQENQPREQCPTIQPCCTHSTNQENQPREQCPTRQPCCTHSTNQENQPREQCPPRQPCCTHSTNQENQPREQCPPRQPCCTHSTNQENQPREQCPPRQPCCTTQPPPGILKHPSTTTGCSCSSQTPSIQEFPKKQSCPKEKPRQSCTNTSEKKPPQPLPPIPHLCRSSEERLFDKNSCFIPYCKQNSIHSNVALTGSHHKFCCLSQLSVDPKKSICTGTSGTNKKSCDSIDIPIDNNALCPPYKKKSSGRQISQEFLQYCSSAKCGGPCENKNSKPKQGISLSQKPNDHKFCTDPTDCKHSKQSEEEPNECKPACSEDCAGACNPNQPPEEEEEAEEEKEEIEPISLSGSGSCMKSSQSYTATPIYKERRMLDSKYEAYLDEYFGKIANMNQSNEDNQPTCDNGCSCVTCIELVKPSHSCSPTDKGPRSDPHNYRFYY